MSKAQAKKLAEKFMQEQERILQEYGDSVVKSKRKGAINSVQQIFQAIANKTQSVSGEKPQAAKS